MSKMLCTTEESLWSQWRRSVAHRGGRPRPISKPPGAAPRARRRWQQQQPQLPRRPARDRRRSATLSWNLLDPPPLPLLTAGRPLGNKRPMHQALQVMGQAVSGVPAAADRSSPTRRCKPGPDVATSPCCHTPHHTTPQYHHPTPPQHAPIQAPLAGPLALGPLAAARPATAAPSPPSPAISSVVSVRGWGWVQVGGVLLRTKQKTH